MTTQAKAVVIGASAGGIEALCSILSELDPACHVPILIVLHLPQSRDTRLVELLQTRTKIPICEIDDKQPLEGGNIYLAPPDYHVLVEDEQSLALSNDSPVNYSRPSIDVLFESAADVFGHRLIGVILTGANRDGADGLARIVKLGGIGIVQTPDRANCRTMPDAAIAAAEAAIVMDLGDIPTYLNARI